MSDIVKRLRATHHYDPPHGMPLRLEAADEVERLQECERLMYRAMEREVEKQKEIERLRAALGAIGNNATEADEPRSYARRALEPKP